MLAGDKLAFAHLSNIRHFSSGAASERADTYFVIRKGMFINTQTAIPTKCGVPGENLHDAHQRSSKNRISVDDEQDACSGDAPTPDASHLFAERDNVIVTT